MIKTEFIEATTIEEKETAFNLRKLVFADEQGIPAHLDQDGKDNLAIHLIATIDQTTIATGRLYIDDKQGHLSRIAVHPNHRGKGLGKKIVDLLIEKAIQKKLNGVYLYPHAYLEDFYKSFGFLTVQNYKSEVAGHKIIKMEKVIRG